MMRTMESKNTIVVGSVLLLVGRSLDRSTRMRVSTPVPRWWRQIGHLWTSRAWEAGAPDWGRRLVVRSAQKTGVPAALIAAVIYVESRWRANAVSSAGAIGLMQLMPGTAEELRVDPWTPAANIDGGARYLRLMLDQFEELTLAVAAYNAGPKRVVAEARVPNIQETRLYLFRVLTSLTTPVLGP